MRMDATRTPRGYPALAERARRLRRVLQALATATGIVLASLSALGLAVYAQPQEQTSSSGGGPASPTVVVEQVVVSPSEILSAEEIETLIAGYVGREVTVDELYGMVEQFNAAYRRKGYVAAAVLPEQFIGDGVVEVQLVEGRIGDVVVSGNQHTQTKFIVDRLGMSPGDLVALNEMDTRLLAFNDTYDVQLHAELRPGKSFGTTDVVVYVFEPDNNEYSLWVDSGGREEFGLERYGFTWTNRSLLGRRDALTLSLTAGKAAWSGMLTYSVPVSRGGARVTTTYSYNHVDVVGGAFHDVDIAGDSSLTDVSVNVPFRNRRGDRFDVVGGYQQLESGTYFEGHRLTGYTLQTWRVGTSGQLVRQDGANRWAYSYNFVSGRDSVVNESFSKHTLTGSFQRLFRNGTVLTLTVSGQLTDADLLPESEQYKLGGISTVRGFLSGQLAGDEGYLVNVEWTGAWMPWLRWTLYLDHGAAFPYKGNLEPIGPEDYVTAAAVGLHVQMTDYLHGQILWGKPLDREDDGVVYLRVQADF